LILKKFNYTPILGWSSSRYDMFKLCKRQYYYNYYAKFDKEFPLTKIKYLKNLTSVALETGSIVHDVLETLFKRLQKSEEEIDQKKFFKYALDLTEKNCVSKNFMEVYYKELKIINANEIYDKVKLCLNNFLESDRYKWIQNKAIRTKNNWIIEPPGYGETRINELKAYCKVDFLYPLDDELFIIDWKTGKQDNVKHKNQLLGYSAWASYHLGKDLKQINSIVSYLYPEYDEYQIKFEEEDANNFSAKLLAETHEMYEYCLNVGENIPKDKSLFPKTTNEKICAFCNYKELCFI